MTITTLTNTVALDKSLFNKTFNTVGADGTHDGRFYSRIHNACRTLGWNWRNLIVHEKQKGRRDHNRLNAFMCVRLLREYLEYYLASPDHDNNHKQYMAYVVPKTIEEIYRRAV